MLGKKGQSAALIGIITLLIIFYIIFIPPEEREKLLGEPGTTSETLPSKEHTLLVDEAPGFLSPTPSKEVEHAIPNTVLNEITSANTILEIPPFTVKTGWFLTQGKKTVFPIKNVHNVKKTIVSFTAEKTRGILKIKLNNIDIFEATINQKNPTPINLPLDLLKEENTLEFEALGIGWWFLPRWFELKDVKIIAETDDPKKRESTHLISLSGAEKEYIDRGTLRFFAICDEQNTGTLTIAVNDKTVFQGTPDCGSINEQELFGSDFNEGKNTITFSLDTGQVRLEQVKLKTKLKEAQPWVQFFQLNETQAANILKNARKTKLLITFVDDRTDKQAEISVNNQKFIVDQKKEVFEKDISRMVKKGNNFISLAPRTELKIVSLQIILE